MTGLYVILLLLMAGSFAAAMMPGFWRTLAVAWRQLPRRDACVLLAAMAAATWYGGQKQPTRAVAQLISVMQDGSLRGPTNVVASALAAAAVDAVLAESDAMLMLASQSVEWCWAELPDLEEAITNTSIAYMQVEIPAPLTTPNLVARADMLQVVDGEDGLRHVMVVFSVVPSSAPLIKFYADNTPCTVVSNSFPATVPVETPGGTSQCYVYTVQVPPDMAGMVLLPEREITFGGGPENLPLSVLGSLMVDDRLGITGTRPVAPGVLGVFEGGLLVEVQDE